jgi:pimeloyl-ACP methyl ester carboxylesterase
MEYSILSNFINTQFGTLHYSKFGNGPNVLLSFHGFGQDHMIAAPMEKILHDRYTIYSFDLPYHGQSSWPENENILSKSHMKEVFGNWLQTNTISQFSVFGYSMGGKFAISLAEQFPNQVNHLILVAPDGIVKTVWYTLAISWPVKSIFRRIIEKPKLFFLFTKVVSSARLVPEKILQFGESQMATRQLRAMVYYTWYNFKELYFDQHILKNSIENNNLKATLILGKLDQVINYKKVISRINNIGFDIKTLEAGHTKVMELAPNIIKDILH